MRIIHFNTQNRFYSTSLLYEYGFSTGVIEVANGVTEPKIVETDKRVRSAIGEIFDFISTPKEFRTPEKAQAVYDHVKAELLAKYKDQITEEDADKLAIATFQVILDMFK